MISTKRFFTILLLFISSIAVAQELEDKTLLTIDGNPYDAGTFMRVYLKNLDIVQDDSQKDIDNYLDLYIDYRLKLLQAYEMNLDLKESYKKELNNYRQSLAQAYLTDTDVTESLIREAYNRKKREVKASHILVKVGPGDAPQDTLKAWNKINAIKNELDNGADFSKLARTKSEGPSAGNEGKLGWFSVFRMVYPFENAAFDTEVGKHSEVFRTDFGYHIVKVFEDRLARGEVTVAHIMTFDARDAEEKTAEKRINDVYKQLQETGRFEELAREFSDDMNSASRGGKLDRFGTGGLNATTFEDIAFGLKEKGEYSAPFKSKFGWHIVKLIEKHPVGSYEDLAPSLKEKIRKSPRARKITDSFNKSLREKYHVERSEKVLEKLNEVISDSILSNSWQYDPALKMADLKMFTIKDEEISYADFYKDVMSRQKKDFTNYSSKEEKVQKFYYDFIDKSIAAYYDKNLENENKDFAFIYDEYKEGLLLFDLLETKIWNKAKEDSTGQQAYYDLHKSKYQWKRRLDIVLTQNTTEEVAQEVQRLLKNGTSREEIKKQFNIDGRTKVMMSNGIVEETYNRIPDNFEVKEGVSSIYYDEKTGFYKVILVKEVLEPSQKTLDEARGAVINDYQQQLEKDWMSSLRNGRTIKVNKKTFKKVKKAIAKDA
ncbi:peptidylprolyl isomerase [Nonlabens ulvanivorans]|uniref:Peptidyl-prolyl cis-trans isomerase SurA n=1 Tax=Nonlabens ulvanivorans TaxID=906888 RepID=A0A084JZK7_NONUL|nr:peptidylprolyl isomerase [Nonlabens ulvanivorans]KEZ94391.1 peptidylprolyl isomerase [Nonlabens ulvanivorans]PRX12283.1 peptidyl-prolyl cis-trans isomerase SurA [Nonlabens ulvanivorans]